MPPLSAEQRVLRARLAAYASHANCADPQERTARAREAFNQRFEDEVDPDRILDPADRARRAEHARRAYFTRLALKASRARQRKAAERRAAS